MTNDKYLSQLCREIASHFEADEGVQLFDWYNVINTTFFDGTLPQAFLITALTAYGSCIGLTKSNPHTLPVILLHPSLKTDEERFYTLLHEAIHVNVRYNLCKGKPNGSGQTSHSHPEWIAEVNRIAKLLGYANVVLGANTVRRLPKSEGGKLTRATTGNVPYECCYQFPRALPEHTGQPLPPLQRWL